jgi:arsenite methyltransferase
MMRNCGGNEMKREKIKEIVTDRYGQIAKKESSCCGPMSPCCGTPDLAKDLSGKIGYTEEELKSVPEGANLGLGCGNPVALASLKEGETVLDLGSGAGFDCFLIANKVGSDGKVIGVDMTPEMIKKARENARQGNYENVEFRLGEIENLPVPDNSIDAVISNCVINLAPDKKRVFKEAFRVLKPGVRMMISDIVLLKELADFIKNSLEAYVGCIAGAVMRDKYIMAIKDAGFQNVKIIDETSFPIECLANDPTAKAFIENLKVPPEKVKEIVSPVISIKVYGIKPGRTN